VSADRRRYCNSTADWLDLRLHLINVRVENAEDPDRVTVDPHGTAKRTKDAQIRHQTHGS
jgi:hypothetical protein